MFNYVKLHLMHIYVLVVKKNIKKCKKKDVGLLKKVRKQVKPKWIFCMLD